MTREPHPDSYYLATAAATADRPALQGEVVADVCVVGAGFTGVSTALNLAERGYDVVVLEANGVGWGASGRNGGQICSGYASGMAAIRSWVGAGDAKRLFALAEEAKAIIRDRVARHDIACDLAWGYFHAAHKARQLRGLEAMAETWQRDYDYPGLRIARGRAEVAAHVDSPAYVGGLYDPGGGHLHPLNYCLGLARAAEAAGARIFEGSRVVRVIPGTAPVAHTAAGAVRANFLVLCGNAYLGDLVPELRRKVMPVGTYVAATERLGEGRARALIPGNAAVSDSRFALNYYRLSPDHRLLFGGGVSYSTLMPPNLPEAMRAKMLEAFPQLRDTAFQYVWGGFVGITMERSPHFGRLGPNIYFAQGFSGQGVALTGVGGRVIAEAVAGQAERFDLFARLPHAPFPGGRLLRTPTLVLAMLWFRMRDLLP